MTSWLSQKATVLDKHLTATVLVAALWLTFMLMLMPPEPNIAPDSSSYLSFSSHRTAGYPLFLKLVGVGNILWVQPVLAALALGFLGYQTSRLTGSALVAGGLMMSIAINQPLFVYHYMVLTESLFVSLNMALIALLMKSALNPDWRVIAIASVLAGVATAVRPVGIFLLPMMLFHVLVLQLPVPGVLRRVTLLAAAFLPFLSVMTLEMAISTWRHGEAVPSLAPRVVFAKSAMIEAPETNAVDPNLSGAEQALANDFAPIRELVAKAPDFATKRYIALEYENCILNRCLDALDLDSLAPEAREAAWTRLTKNPHGYLALTWMHYRSLWTVYSATHSAVSRQISAFITKQRPLPFEPLVPVLLEPVPVARFAVIVEPVVMAIGIATFGLALVGVLYLLLRRPLPAVGIVATTTALGVHGGLLLTALTGLGIPRYFLALWPLMMTALVCGAWWIVAQRGPRSLREWLRCY